MAHNIAIINGQISMAYQGVTPWHKLGNRMNGTTDVDAAIVAANLDWRVALETVHLQDGRLVPDRMAVVRDVDSKILGTVGPQFEPVQNRDGFGLLSDACRDYGVTIESAGALGNGERVWMLAKLPNGIEPIDGDKINGYFLLSNGHDGSLAYSARLTPIRVVCQNTLSAALSERDALITLRHTKTIDNRLKQVKTMIDRLMATLKATGETFGSLAAKRMTSAEIAAYIESVIPMPAGDVESPTIKARRDTIAKLVWCGKGAEMAGSDANGSTAWAAYNAVVEYFDHVRPAEAQSVSARNAANESAIFGVSAQLKLKALQRATQLVAA